MPVRRSELRRVVSCPMCSLPSRHYTIHTIPPEFFRLMRLQAKPVVSCVLLVVLASRVVVDAVTVTCDGVSVTEPVSIRDSTGWDSQDLGAGKRRQGHVSAEVTAWGQEHVVVFGGTSLRSDDVNDVFAQGNSVEILDISNPQNWTELEMVGASTQRHSYLPRRDF